MKETTYRMEFCFQILDEKELDDCALLREEIDIDAYSQFGYVFSDPPSSCEFISKRVWKEVKK